MLGESTHLDESYKYIINDTYRRDTNTSVSESTELEAPRFYVLHELQAGRASTTHNL